MLDATYTWSRNMEDTNTGIEDGQGFNAGGTATNWDINNRENNRMIGLSDVPHRLVATFLYQVPLSIKGQASAPMRIVKAVAARLAGRRLGDLADRLPDRHQRCAARVRRWRVRIVSKAWISCCPRICGAGDDGRTAVTLPSGRVITPANRTYLKYNPDAFVGRVVTTPSGAVVADQVPGTATRPRPTTISGPTRASTSTSACGATFRSRDIVWSSVWM